MFSFRCTRSFEKLNLSMNDKIGNVIDLCSALRKCQMLKWINSVRCNCSKFDAFILLENLNMLFIYVQHLESVKCLNDLEIYDLPGKLFENLAKCFRSDVLVHLRNLICQ